MPMLVRRNIWESMCQLVIKTTSLTLILKANYIHPVMKPTCSELIVSITSRVHTCNKQERVSNEALPCIICILKVT